MENVITLGGDKLKFRVGTRVSAISGFSKVYNNFINIRLLGLKFHVLYRTQNTKTALSKWMLFARILYIYYKHR